MARYDSQHKHVTRGRILESAGRRLKRDGIDSSGIAALMADAGLTNGAFYAHFASKEDLVAAVVREELRLQSASFAELASGRAGVEQLVRAYLSQQHRDHRDVGCPSAALLDEIVRSTDETRGAYTEGAKTIVDEIAARLAPEQPESAHGKALILFTMIIGTLQLARAVNESDLSDATLAHGLQQALTLLEVEPTPNREVSLGDPWGRSEQLTVKPPHSRGDPP